MSWEDILKKQFNFGMLDFKIVDSSGAGIILVLEARYSAEIDEIYNFRLLKYSNKPHIILVHNPNGKTIYDKDFSSDNLEDVPNNIIQEVEEVVRNDIEKRNTGDFPRFFQDMNKSVRGR